MAQTIPDIIVTSIWQSINTLSSISIGTAMSIDNKTIGVVLLAEGTQPASDSLDGVPLTTYKDNKSTGTVVTGSLEIWARTESTTATSRIAVQRIP